MWWKSTRATPQLQSGKVGAGTPGLCCSIALRMTPECLKIEKLFKNPHTNLHYNLHLPCFKSVFSGIAQSLAQLKYLFNEITSCDKTLSKVIPPESMVLTALGEVRRTMEKIRKMGERGNSQPPHGQSYRPLTGLLNEPSLLNSQSVPGGRKEYFPSARRVGVEHRLLAMPCVPHAPACASGAARFWAERKPAKQSGAGIEEALCGRASESSLRGQIWTVSCRCPTTPAPLGSELVQG